MGETLKNAPDGSTIVWNNPRTRTSYEVTPKASYERDDGRYCREFISERHRGRPGAAGLRHRLLAARRLLGDRSGQVIPRSADTDPFDGARRCAPLTVHRTAARSAPDGRASKPGSGVPFCGLSAVVLALLFSGFARSRSRIEAIRAVNLDLLPKASAHDSRFTPWLLKRIRRRSRIGRRRCRSWISRPGTGFSTTTRRRAPGVPPSSS